MIHKIVMIIIYIQMIIKMSLRVFKYRAVFYHVTFSNRNNYHGYELWLVFGWGVQKVIVVNPSSRIHIPDGLIRSLCRHIDPFDLDFSPEKLNRWCMRSHFDFFSVRARD